MSDLSQLRDDKLDFIGLDGQSRLSTVSIDELLTNLITKSFIAVRYYHLTL